MAAPAEVEPETLSREAYNQLDTTAQGAYHRARYKFWFDQFCRRKEYNGPFRMVGAGSCSRQTMTLVACDQCRCVHRFDERRCDTLPECMSPLRPGVDLKGLTVQEYCFQFGQDVTAFHLRSEWLDKADICTKLEFGYNKLLMRFKVSKPNFRLQLVHQPSFKTFFQWFNGVNASICRPQLPYTFAKMNQHGGCDSFASQEDLLPHGLRARPADARYFEQQRQESLVVDCEPEVAPSGETWDESFADEESPPRNSTKWRVYPGHRLTELWHLVPAHLQRAFCLSRLPALHVVAFDISTHPGWDPMGYAEECRGLQDLSHIDFPDEDDDETATESNSSDEKSDSDETEEEEEEKKAQEEEGEDRDKTEEDSGDKTEEDGDPPARVERSTTFTTGDAAAAAATKRSRR